MAEELKQLLESLKEPESVLVNMMRGTIARPSARALSKLFGDVINGEDAQLLEIARLREELAQLTSQGGEAVEVVGYGFKHVDKGWLFSSKAYHEVNPCLEGFGLMTVAQHQRILLSTVIRCEQKGEFKICLECGYQDGHDPICQYHESKRTRRTQAVTREDAEQFLASYHAEVWAAAEGWNAYHEKLIGLLATGPVDSQELPGMWEPSDLSGGETDQPDQVTVISDDMVQRFIATLTAKGFAIVKVTGCTFCGSAVCPMRASGAVQELIKRAADVVEGLHGEDLPGAIPVRIQKLKAALEALP